MSEEPAAAQRKSTSFFPVAAVFAALFVVGVIVVIAMQHTFVAADRVVAHHVPPDAAGVLRLDLEKATLFAPVRRSLMPLLDQRNAPGSERWERLGARSELVLGRDSREALVAWGPSADDWALAVGGNFPAGVIDAVESVFRDEGQPWRRDGETLVSPAGRAMGQASDRALLLASSAGRLERLLPSSEEHLRHGIPLKGALSFSGDPRRLAWLGQAMAPLGPVERVTASAEWSSPLAVNIEFTYAQAPPGDAPARVTAMLRDLLEPAEAERLTHAVGPPGVKVTGSRLIVTTRWDHAGLERLAERLGASLRPQ